MKKSAPRCHWPHFKGSMALLNSMDTGHSRVTEFGVFPLFSFMLHWVWGARVCVNLKRLL